MIIFLYALCIALSIAISILLWLNYKVSLKFTSNMGGYSANKNGEMEDLYREVNRQSIVIDDYKKRLQFNVTDEMPKLANGKGAVDFKLNNSVVKDHMQLEREKELFKQKNQKLWEQSIAVYKEKEKVDAIRKYIEVRHESLTDSINYALRIQEALLPTVKYLDKVIPNHFVLYHPLDIVSGDFYWVREIDNKIFTIVADCTGHGVPGAFMSLLGISFLNELLGKDSILSAAQILERMRIKVKSVFRQDDDDYSVQDGMDMVVCIANKDTQELQFAGANNGIFIAREDQSITHIKGTRNPISVYQKEIPFENHSIILQANDIVYMYSDGYFDQFGGPNNKKLTKKRFVNLLTTCHEKKLSLSEIQIELQNFLENWQGEEIQIDDVLLMGVNFFADKSDN